jgi:hypothetical protein
MKLRYVRDSLQWLAFGSGGRDAESVIYVTLVLEFEIVPSDQPKSQTTSHSEAYKR